MLYMYMTVCSQSQIMYTTPIKNKIETAHTPALLRFPGAMISGESLGGSSAEVSRLVEGREVPSTEKLLVGGKLCDNMSDSAWREREGGEGKREGGRGRERKRGM